MSKLKNQLNDITSGNKTPASIVALERESKKAEKEVGILQRQYDELMDLLESKQADALSLKGNISDEVYSTLTSSIKKLETETDNLAVKLDNAKEKSANLSRTLATTKLNPANSKDVQELNSKIELTSSKLETSKNKANDLKNQLNSSLNLKSNLGNELNKIGGKMASLGGKLKSVFAGNNGMNSFGKKIDHLSKKVTQFGNRISNLILSAFVFNVLSSGLSKLSQGLIGALKSNNQFSSSLNQIKVNLLTAFAPIYNYILPAINSLMSVLASITGQIASFVSGLFGKTVSQSKQNAKALYDQAKAYDAVGKSAKEAEGNTASFDNLEVIGGNDNSGDSGGGNNIESPDFSVATEQSGKLLDFLNQIKNLIKEGDFFGLGKFLGEKITDALNNIPWNEIESKARTIGTNIANFINGGIQGTDWSVVGNTISQGINTAISFINGFVKTLDFNEVGKAVGTTLSTAIKNIKWDEFFQTLSDGIAGLIEFLSGLLYETDYSEAQSSFVEGLFNVDPSRLFKALFRFIGQATAQLIKVMSGIYLWELINTYLIQPALDNIFNGGVDIGKGFGEGIKSWFLSIGTWIKDNIFDPFINGFKDMFGIHSPSTVMMELGGFLIEGLFNGLQGIWEHTKEIFINLKTNISTKFQEILSNIKSIFSVEKIKKHFNEVVEAIKSIFSFIPNWFKDKFSQAWTNVKNVFSSGGKIFDGIKDGILSTFKTIVNGIIRGINKVITIPFNGINNSLSRIKNISILGNRPFSGLINTISVPQIPMLAKGAVIPPNAKFLAMLGDQTNGRNLEAPESLIRKIVKEESGDKDVVFNGTFIVQCGDMELGRASLRGLRLMEQQNGKKYLVN